MFEGQAGKQWQIFLFTQGGKITNTALSTTHPLYYVFINITKYVHKTLGCEREYKKITQQLKQTNTHKY